MMPGDEIKVNQVWTTDTHGRGGQIFDIWVQEIVPSDMQTVCDIKWAYVFRPWESHESEYYDFIQLWKLKWEVHANLPNHKPGDKPFTHYERDHQELHRYRMQLLPVYGKFVGDQPLSELIESLRSELGTIRGHLSDVQSTGLYREQLETADHGLTLVISYLYGIMRDMREHEKRPVGQ